MESALGQGGVDLKIRGHNAVGCAPREGLRDLQVGGVYLRVLNAGLDAALQDR
jgi:hypothetical protein